MHEKYMKLAIKEARKAKDIREVPVGAIIVKDDRVIARAYNLREKKQSAIAHAEILAIEKACKKLGTWRLEGCKLYVTLEPCAMCAGAILLARIEEVIFGAKDHKGGCIESCIQLYQQPGFNHYPSYLSGVLEEECASLMSHFFTERRKEKKTIKKEGR